MAFELYNDGVHKCVSFFELVKGHGIQANQFLVIHGSHSALIDPGGDLIYQDLFVQSYRYLFTKNLEYVIGSHQDPDIISSLARWLERTEATILVPSIWQRFIPHFSPLVKNSTGRIQGIPDPGMRIPLGESELIALPAHFLHSEGNFQFYDPIAKILFSGDMGASLLEMDTYVPVEHFEGHIRHMETFHKRYMCGNKACRLWARMVRELDMEWIVPQHGRPFKGRPMIDKFLDWVENLECGLDLMDENAYRLPAKE